MPRTRTLSSCGANGNRHGLEAVDRLAGRECEEITPQSILTPHRERTLGPLQGPEHVLIIRESTDLHLSEDPGPAASGGARQVPEGGGHCRAAPAPGPGVGRAGVGCGRPGPRHPSSRNGQGGLRQPLCRAEGVRPLAANLRAARPGRAGVRGQRHGPGRRSERQPLRALQARVSPGALRPPPHPGGAAASSGSGVPEAPRPSVRAVGGASGVIGTRRQHPTRGKPSRHGRAAVATLAAELLVPRGSANSSDASDPGAPKPTSPSVPSPASSLRPAVSSPGPPASRRVAGA